MSSPTQLDAASLFAGSARRWRDRVALVADGRQTTYAELGERVHRLAGGLRSLGVDPGDRVVMVLPNGARFVETWWAAVSAGAVVVPLNVRCAPEELRRFIEDCAPRCIVTDRDHLALVASSSAAASAVQPSIVCTNGAQDGADAFDDLIGGSTPLVPDASADLSAPCAIYYTAGTTGISKGVVRSQLSVTWGLSMIAQRMSQDDVLLARAPMAHAGGSLTGPFAVLVAGGTLVIPERTDPDALLDLIARHRVTRFYVHPVLSAKALFAALDRSTHDLRCVRLLQWTAGSMPDTIRDEILRRFPGVPLEVTYGMTEVSNIATYRYDGPPRKPANCVGFPWPGSEIGIVDRDGAFVADGGEGEVVVRSPTAMSRYWNAPELTAQVTRGGWVHTGDIGCLDADGALLLTGRLKDAINTAGMTVHAAEVEHAIAAHAEVVDAAVFGLPDVRWEEAVTAVVACRPSAQLSEDDVLDHCRVHLTSYKIPKRVYIVSELPRNSSNKVDKRALRAQYAAAGPPPD